MRKMGRGLVALFMGAGFYLAPVTLTFAEAAKPALNTTCPVSGRAVNAKITTVYQGKGYAFCCKSCLAKFEKNPEKYLAQVKTGEITGEEHAGHEH
mgnify:CR=1 FL=1